MNRRFWVHAGLHKTGTTFIQRYCLENRSSLLDQGYLFPLTGLHFPFNPTNQYAMVGHSNLQPLFSGDNSERTQKLRQDFEREVDESGATNVFVSSELFTAPRNLENCAQGIRQNFGDNDAVKLIVYLRRQDRFIESMYKEILGWKGRRETREFFDFLIAEGMEWMDYQSILSILEKGIGKDSMYVRSYDDALAGPGLLHDFFAVLGIDAELMPAPQGDTTPVNPSVQSRYVDLLRAVNSFPEITNFDKSQIGLILSRAAPANTNETLLDDRSLSFIDEQFATQNAAIARRYMQGATERFSNPEPNASRTLVVPAIDMDLARNLLSQLAFSEHLLHRTGTLAGDRDTTFGVITTRNDSPQQTREFVNYHLNTGASHLVLFFDLPGDPAITEYEDSRQVTCVSCCEEHWQRLLGRQPRDALERVRVNSDFGRRILADHGVDWVIYLDADELLTVRRDSIRRIIGGLKPNLQVLHVCPIAVIQQAQLSAKRCFRAASYQRFKPRVSRYLQAAQKLLLGRAGKRLQECIFGPFEGRAFVRSNIRVDYCYFPYPDPEVINSFPQSVVLESIDLLRYGGICREGWRATPWGRGLATTATADQGKQSGSQSGSSAPSLPNDDLKDPEIGRDASSRVYRFLLWFGRLLGLMYQGKLSDDLFESFPGDSRGKQRDQ